MANDGISIDRIISRLDEYLKMGQELLDQNMGKNQNNSSDCWEGYWKCINITN